MKELLLFADDGQLNEATTWYVGTIATVAESLGFRMRHVRSLGDIRDRDAVLVVECKSAFRLSVLRPKARVWLWMQGVFPEEARLHFASRSREWLWRLFERVSLPRLQGVIMVSQAMRLHFGERYPAFDLSTFVMPCVNARLDNRCFRFPGKYDHPRFVYAGSLHAWQCMAQTLAVFRKIKTARPDARLAIFTKEVESARQMTVSHGLNGVEIVHVPLDSLQDRLAEFKYGFVLRQEHLVNRVATPTKVSSYMAAGVIPVMTRAVQDYNTALGEVEPIVISARLDVDLIARDVLAQEARPVDAEQVLRSYRRVFEGYFNHEAYVNGLRAFFEHTGLRA